jgi:pyridoxamine 5'-phosphate oxidase family protein
MRRLGRPVDVGMSVFTDQEIDYLAGQRLGRIATVGADGQPHVVPTSFRYNPEHDAIEVGGLRMSQTKKLRDVQRTGRASIVIDDVLPPWQPRMIEIRGTAVVLPSGGKALGERFEDTIVRIQPKRIISFGINADDVAASARSVNES